MKITFLALLLCSPAITIAQTYKCSENGKNVYSDRPCSAKAVVLNIGDSAAEKQRLRDAAAKRDEATAAMARAISEVKQQSRIASGGAGGASNRAVASTHGDKTAYCSQLQQTAKDAKDESNKWRYHQGLIDDARRRQKEAEDEYFSNCYGSNF